MILFTSLASNYIPKARALYRSLKKIHPKLHFAIVLVDKDYTKGIPKGILESSADEVIGLKELLRGKVENLDAWAFSHNVMELCTAVKGAAFERFFDRGANEVVFLDPDIWILDSLELVFEEFRKHSILLTPHSSVPELKPDRISFIECGFLKHGVFNLGFLGVKNDASGRAFVKWWTERLLGWCYMDPTMGLFTDQKWIDLVPVFFDGVHILRDPGLNTARWNMGRHPVSRSRDGKLRIGGSPIRFFHFSGMESGEHEMMLARFAEGNTLLRELTNEYRKALAQETPAALNRVVPALDYFTDLAPCTQLQRTLYRQRIDLQRAFPRPRQVTYDEPCFLHWYKEDLRRSLMQQVSAIEPSRMAEYLKVAR